MVEVDPELWVLVHGGVDAVLEQGAPLPGNVLEHLYRTECDVRGMPGNKIWKVLYREETPPEVLAEAAEALLTGSDRPQDGNFIPPEPRSVSLSAIAFNTSTPVPVLRRLWSMTLPQEAMAPNVLVEKGSVEPWLRGVGEALQANPSLPEDLRRSVWDPIPHKSDFEGENVVVLPRQPRCWARDWHEAFVALMAAAIRRGPEFLWSTGWVLPWDQRSVYLLVEHLGGNRLRQVARVSEEDEQGKIHNFEDIDTVTMRPHKSAYEWVRDGEALFRLQAGTVERQAAELLY